MGNRPIFLKVTGFLCSRVRHHDIVVLRRVIERNIADLEQTLECETLSAWLGLSRTEFSISNWHFADNSRVRVPRQILVCSRSRSQPDQLSTAHTRERARDTQLQSIKAFAHGRNHLRHLSQQTPDDLNDCGVTLTKRCKSFVCGRSANRYLETAHWRRPYPEPDWGIPALVADTHTINLVVPRPHVRRNTAP